MLFQEYTDVATDAERFEKLNKVLDETEAIAIQAASKFLDVFHEQLEKRIENHNRYLERAGREHGMDLA